ncbi:hypothetical protein L1049_011428 [Liquidambar formosana]|uniref:RRM domain-containing protein n=1 Tax=Liquidambar formosana TaxID=63359 RepID=A0AAP0X230_LIQFO
MASVTQEQFNLFHSIDRRLYARFVVNLGRDPAESMQVMALWLWLERVGHDQFLVKRMLSLPDTIINGLADEAVMCLNCVEHDQFPFSLDGVSNDIPLIQSIMLKIEVSLRFFHMNRLTVIREVTKIVNDICARAFKDIYQKVLEDKAYNLTGGDGFGNVEKRMGEGQMMQPVPTPTAMPRPAPALLNVELSELLSHINLTGTEEEKEVPQDDRTIFLTFSKGYPISENEVRDFFTGKYGDCIDAVYMQEVVHPEEQVLFARLVVRSVTTIDAVLNGQNKAKFTINGKHVWARKYVRKHPKSPSQTPSASLPTSPASAATYP